MLIVKIFCNENLMMKSSVFCAAALFPTTTFILVGLLLLTGGAYALASVMIRCEAKTLRLSTFSTRLLAFQPLFHPVLKQLVQSHPYAGPHHSEARNQPEPEMSGRHPARVAIQLHYHAVYNDSQDSTDDDFFCHQSFIPNPLTSSESQKSGLRTVFPASFINLAIQELDCNKKNEPYATQTTLLYAPLRGLHKAYFCSKPLGR